MLSIEELANLEVTSVAKRPQSQLAAAAAVYVITREQILRSGATSIPEALRLAPGVEVARIDAHTWAISIRGFNSTSANKLLVLLDGRSLYTPLFSGVFWDVQDTLLEDVERIEVIAGPGGTLWGANAVNGIINIITRSARDSRGGFLEAGGGDEERWLGAVRYGARWGEHADARFYAKGFARDAGELADGHDADDGWEAVQAGFRVDWEGATDTLTAQGDLYSGEQESGATDAGGANLLVRWERRVRDRSTLRLQAYWDHTDRDIQGAFSAHRNTYDLELQQNLGLGSRHDVVWGLGYRMTRDHVAGTPFIAFLPEQRADQVFSAFLQDEIDLWRERLALTVGTKVEHNNYTGYELQPSLRLAFLVSDRQTVWAAVSRAVRTPSRLDSDLVLSTQIDIPTVPVPVLLEVRGDDDFAAEELVAYEAGYRVQPADTVSVDFAAFYNRYDELRTTEAETPRFVPTPTPHILLPNRVANGLAGTASGATLTVRWAPIPALVVSPSYTYLDLDLHPRPGSVDQGTERETEGSSPRHQWRLTAFWDLPSDVHLYAAWRRAGELPARGVEAQSMLDLGVSWRPTRRLELSVAGQNLLEERHREFALAGSAELQRGVYCKAAWRF